MGTPPLPVTVAATRRARPAREAELQQWATTLCSAAAEFPGLERSEVRGRQVDGAAYVTAALTFDSAAAASAWESSPERADLVARGDLLTEGDTVAIPLLPGATQQPRWKMALVVWAGLFPFALALNLAGESPLAAMAVLPRTILTTAVLVPLAVYAGIPAVQRLMRSWRPGVHDR